MTERATMALFDMHEAEAEIERLRDENERLRQTLREIAALPGWVNTHHLIARHALGDEQQTGHKP